MVNSKNQINFHKIIQLLFKKYGKKKTRLKKIKIDFHKIILLLFKQYDKS